MSDTPSLVGKPLLSPEMLIIAGWPRWHGRMLTDARYAKRDTGLEHGPQTYLGAVASRAALIEASDPRYSPVNDRDVAIGLAFTQTPYPHHFNPRISDPERAYVRRVLEAGDHAADLAALSPHLREISGVPHSGRLVTAPLPLHGPRAEAVSTAVVPYGDRPLTWRTRSLVARGVRMGTVSGNTRRVHGPVPRSHFNRAARRADRNAR